MKKLVSLILFTFLLGSFNAQPPIFDDLLILFADGNYPKLIREANKYAEKDATKNNPLVYLYMAKGFYKISFVADRDEEYKNAFKDTFSALGKCLAKDKDGKIREENAEFFQMVKRTLIETITNDVESKDYRKAAGWANKVYKISPNDVGAKYLEGACKFQTADKGGANAFWKEADKLLKEIKDFSALMPEDKELLKIGVFETANCYLTMKQIEKAKTLLNKVAQWYEGDSSFKEKYDQIVN
jgi:tetratricopeptide (TPR) repeat protein